MRRFSRVSYPLLCAAVLPVLMASGCATSKAPAPKAFVEIPADRTDAPDFSARVAAADRKLPPLTVNGVRIPLTITLQMIKAALDRPWSQDLVGMDDLVCRRVDTPSVHPDNRIPTLHCDTNQGHYQSLLENHYRLKPSDRKVHCFDYCFLTKNSVVISIFHYVNSDPQRARVLSSLLDYAPPRYASYVLRVPQTVPMRFLANAGKLDLNYPLLVDFMIQQGSLADVELKDRRGANAAMPTLLTSRELRAAKRHERATAGASRPGHALKSEDIVCVISNMTC